MGRPRRKQPAEVLQTHSNAESPWEFHLLQDCAVIPPSPLFPNWDDAFGFQQQHRDMVADTDASSTLSSSTLSPTTPTDLCNPFISDSGNLDAMYEPSAQPDPSLLCVGRESSNDLGSIVSQYAQLSQFLFQLNMHAPHDMLAQGERGAFHSLSSLVSSLCETLRIFEERPLCHAGEKLASSSFLLAALVVGKAVGLYHEMARSLCHPASAQPIGMHRRLRLLADIHTMELQLEYMRQMFRASNHLLSVETVKHVDETIAILQKYAALWR
ncbi:Fungal transcriptional regulatory [Cordyceps militaris]|uniref:Fungal transcriptional regulatory n=1 Tax=Cordyceps militaris TaxID=73501 RepID=A0A2H4SBR1_CORMI|nr:Fungal transcriptional regulatory [Cordyceps militaris]